MTPLGRGIISSGKLGSEVVPPEVVLRNTLALDGIDQYATLGNVESVGTGDASWSMMFRLTDKTSPHMILTKENSASTDTEYRVNSDTSGFLQFFIEIDVLNKYHWSYEVDVADGVYRKLQWSSNRASNKPSVWIDGVDVSASLVDSGSAGSLVTGTIANSSSVNIGSRDIGGSEVPFEGDVANVFMIGRNFTPADITELQTIKQLDLYSTTIMDDYNWAIPLNNGVANPEADVSLNSHDATLVNGPTYTGEQIPILGFDP